MRISLPKLQLSTCSNSRPRPSAWLAAAAVLLALTISACGDNDPVPAAAAGSIGSMAGAGNAGGSGAAGMAGAGGAVGAAGAAGAAAAGTLGPAGNVAAAGMGGAGAVGNAGAAAGAGAGMAGAPALPPMPLPPPPPPPDNLPAKLATSLCRAVNRCSMASSVFAGGCEQRVRASLEHSEIGYIATLMSKGSVRYGANALAGCMQAIEGASCSALSRFKGQVAAIAPACATLIEGTVAPGGACAAQIECTGATHCDFSTGCPGTCAVTIAAGQACTTDAQCAAGLMCPEQGTCAPVASQGQACDDMAGPLCELGQLCIPAPGAMMMSTCRAEAQVFTVPQGQACDLQMIRLCALDAVCVVSSPTSMQCVPRSMSGAPCPTGLAVIPEPCPAAEYCNPPGTGMGMGTCTPLPGAGAPCEERCQAGLYCGTAPGALDSMCQPLVADGLGCTLDEECVSDNCMAGRCVPSGMCLP